MLLDGFNEAALSWVNAARGAAVAGPSVGHMEMFDDVPCLHAVKGRDLAVPELVTSWPRYGRRMHG